MQKEIEKVKLKDHLRNLKRNVKIALLRSLFQGNHQDQFPPLRSHQVRLGPRGHQTFRIRLDLHPLHLARMLHRGTPLCQALLQQILLKINKKKQFLQRVPRRHQLKEIK